MSPEISIVIPIYNVEQYLRDCLESILRQTFKNWECILINDGSTDKSGEICDEYCHQDARFKVIHKVNGGVSSARNEGLKVARGNWLCFVDSDDYIVENGLEYMLNLCLRTESDVCICTLVKEDLPYFGTKILNEHEKKDLIWACLAYHTYKYASKGLLIDGPCAKLYRLSIINDYSIRYVEGLCKSEDALFTAEYYYHASRIVMDSYQVYNYTNNPNSICHTYNKAHIKMLGTLLELEQSFVYKYYRDTHGFDNVVKIRAIAALRQVLFESDAHRRQLSVRTKALHTFFMAGNVDFIIRNTKYSEIKPYFSDSFQSLDFWFAKHHLYIPLCLWLDLRLALFNIRVWMVSQTKKILGISPTLPLSTLFTKK